MARLSGVERVFGAGIWWCRGCVPPVWVPQCVAGVSAVLTFSDTLPYCSPYCGALPSTSRVFGPLASSSLSLLHRASFTPTPHGSVVPVVGPPQHCTSAVPHNPHPHNPLLPQGCHAPHVLFYSLLVCVHKRYCFLFLSAVCPLWFAALPTLPPLCVAVLCAVPWCTCGTVGIAMRSYRCVLRPNPQSPSRCTLPPPW